jgi:hypothetical protein
MINSNKKTEMLILGSSIIIGLFLLGTTIGKSILDYKAMDRTVVVKGLAQKEVNADIVIWPITYLRASNNLSELYKSLDNDTEAIKKFLKQNGFKNQEITLSAPHIVDKIAQNYGGSNKIQYRYSGVQTLTLYTKDIKNARKSMTAITTLGKRGITFRSNGYDNRIEYIYTKLNEIKPGMIKEATKNARISAQTFANDSQSKLGKIKSARQGQFSIYMRDKNTPYIKRVRVVSTIEYYLND